MSIYAPSLTSLWQQLMDMGIEPAPLFARHQVAFADLADAGARAPFARIDALLAEATELSGDVMLRAREAEYVNAAQMGALGFAWLASDTVRRALIRLERFVRVVNTRCTVDLREVGSELRLRVELSAPSLNAWMWDSGSLTGVTRATRIIAGTGWAPVWVALPHPAPGRDRYLEEYCRCPVRYDADGTVICFDARQVDETLPGSSAQLAQLNDHAAVKYLAHLDKTDVVSRAKASILNRLGEGTAIEPEIAGDLNVSPRSLSRRLASDGISFRSLVSEVRKELAEQYLGDPSLTMTEISYMLGFAEVSSFSRAYRRWHGEPPSAARRSHS